jgi:hypothetical protein
LLSLCSGERALTRRQELVARPGSQKLELRGLGSFDLEADEQTGVPEDLKSLDSSFVEFLAPGTWLLEIGSPSGNSQVVLEETLGRFIPSNLARGIAEYGFRERLIRARSDNQTLPEVLTSAGATCLDIRVPTAHPRYGSYDKNITVSQRWLRMFIGKDWLVGLWSPPTVSSIPGTGGAGGADPAEVWREVLEVNGYSKASGLLPRSERWRTHERVANDFSDPLNRSGPALAMRFLQDAAVATRHALRLALDEIALCEYQLFTETISDESWVTCDFDKVQVDLMTLGGFLFDLGEDIVMLEARATGEFIFDAGQREELADFTEELQAGVGKPREELRSALNTLVAMKQARRINVDDESKRRNRRLEVIVALGAAVTLIPGLVFAAFQTESIEWALPSAVLFAIVSVGALLLILKRDLSLVKGLDRDAKSWTSHTERLDQARRRHENIAWDPEWPKNRRDR